MTRVSVLAVPLLLVSAGLSSCGLVGGGSSLDEALDLAPADSQTLIFHDRRASAERLGVDDVETGADEEELKEYADATRDEPSSGARSIFANSIYVMQEAPFSELDVEWSFSGGTEDGFFDVYRLDDDVDLDAVGQDMKDVGFDSDEEDGRTRYTVSASAEQSFDGLIAGRYPAQLADLTLVPDEHLVIRGDPGLVLSVMDGDDESAGEAGTFDDVLSESDDVESAWLRAGTDCGDTFSQIPPESLARMISDEGLDQLGVPDASALVVSGSDEEAEVSAVLQLPDEDAAKADLKGRTAYAAGGHLANAPTPFSAIADAELERDGDLVRVELDVEEPTALSQMAFEGDGILLCNPS